MIIDQLRSEIRRHDLLYYVHNRPEISDSEYDRLFAELGRLEAERPELVTPDSPTQRVSERPLEAFASLTHAVPMLSINSVYDESGVRGFCKAAGDAELVAEPKIDGLAVSLIYEGGKLVRAATRGDGKTGDDVTANARTIKTIPLSISYADWIEVRGEVYIPLSKFSAIEIRTGNTGRQTPVVNFEPVELCGATVRKASLGSVDNLRTMDIQAGDTVLVERVGGCVPQIVGVTSRRKSA